MGETLKERLERLSEAATPMRLESAEIIQDEGWFECGMCNGQGETWGNGYLNVDGVALNVQFSGIGAEFGANQEFVMALIDAYRSGDLIPRDEITPQMAAEVRAEAHAAAVEAAYEVAERHEAHEGLDKDGNPYVSEEAHLFGAGVAYEIKQEIRDLHTDASRAAIERIKWEAREEALAMANADTLALEIAKRLSATDPDVEPWGVRWAELLGDALTVDGGTKAKASAITALIEKDKDDE